MKKILQMYQLIQKCRGRKVKIQTVLFWLPWLRNKTSNGQLYKLLATMKMSIDMMEVFCT